jgi:hypothetical protein
VEYDGASRPQFFAAGAPVLVLRTLLGRTFAMVRSSAILGPDGIPPIGG